MSDTKAEMFRCPRCQGMGVILKPNGEVIHDCTVCDGTGEVTGDRAADNSLRSK